MVEAKRNSINLTDVNTEKIQKLKSTSIERNGIKGYLKHAVIRDAIISIATYIASNPLTEFFTFRLQDILGKEILLALGESAYDIYSIISNAIMANPGLLALGVTGALVIGEGIYISVNAIKNKIKEGKSR